ncbi:hypothetical protein MAPG_07959 [Magnaporthiopsis poae ATCC 64411]|uniref:Polyprenal reductase n=1 Tax=Magnaporthiopsis poae (strain ATCC 64411 / 73-15) TaxID=644358 RepID=A0A0C4E629_MAGP6|nr:hypothetical protein MAPG_07959 [Magnaporthiopsis poae ATCC 64411]
MFGRGSKARAAPTRAQLPFHRKFFSSTQNVHLTRLFVRIRSLPKMDLVTAAIPQLSPAQWCQSFFTLAAAGILAVTVLPSRLGRLLLGYGPRSSGANGSVPATGSGWLEASVSTLTAWGQVPHWWFGSFYATSLACSAFWAYQYIVGGTAIRLLASSQHTELPDDKLEPQISPHVAQGVFMAWALTVLQGVRRFYEQVFVAKKSASTMWIIHWMLGTAFYMVMSITVWIEGAVLILVRQPASTIFAQTPSVKAVLGSLMFAVGSAAQYSCHSHLASLKKYSLPTQGLFRYLVCPHYTCECLLYLSLAIVAAPEGELLNRTIISALLFVVVNLGATAHGTRKWYVGRFGAPSVESRWTMIPLVY